MQKVIYYFSGTGNSMRAAYRVAAALGDTEIISMRCDPSEVPAVDADVIGFVFPVYHWTMPDTVIRFIKGLRINPNAYIFGISTLIYINCHSFEVLDGLLKEKSAYLAYARTLPSVGTSLTSYETRPDPSRQVPKSEENLTRIAAEIVERKKRRFPRANLLTRMAYPSRVKYIEMLPKADKGFLISDKCAGCGLCAQVCPCQNIEMRDGTPTFRHQCNFCTACIAFCPVKAINYEVTPELKEKYPFYNFTLTEDKTRYHNPHVSSADMASNCIHID